MNIKTRKSIISLFLFSAIAFSLSACQKNQEKTSDSEKNTENDESTFATEITTEETDTEPNETETDSSKIEKKEKNGFNEDTNSAITIGNYVFSIPDYWETNTQDENQYIAGAQSSENVTTAVLKINVSEDKNDTVTFDILKKQTENGKMTEAFQSWFDSCGDVEVEEYDNNIYKGYIYSSDVTLKNSDGYAKCLVLPFEEDNNWVFVLSLETINSEYTYFGDFEKIIDSIERNENTSQKEPTADEIKTAFDNGDFSLVTPEFKETMDSYEAFYDDYIAFMKKYNSGEADVFSMLNDYTSMLTKMTEWSNKIDAIDENSLSLADDAYYLLVTVRVEKKLLNSLT